MYTYTYIVASIYLHYVMNDCTDLSLVFTLLN
jgi:hypothetical protein